MSKQEKEGKIILNNEHRVCNATGLLIMLLMVSKLSIAAVVGCLTCLIKISACHGLQSHCAHWTSQPVKVEYHIIVMGCRLDFAPQRQCACAADLCQ